MRMTREEAIDLLRDTTIDIRSTREDDIHTLYATAQMMAIDALRPVSREQGRRCGGVSAIAQIQKRVALAAQCAASIALDNRNINKLHFA